MEMIRQIIWAQPLTDEPQSPFARGDVDRKMKITFHSESYSNAPYDELRAIDALRELSNLQDIHVADTVKSELPYLEIGSFNLLDDYIPVTLVNGNSTTHAAITLPNQCLDIAKSLTKKTEKSDPEVQQMLTEIMIMRAHQELNYDLLVTLSPQLLKNRDNNFISETNPCTPLEAVKIVGLYLRFREIYTIEAKNFTHNLNRDLFYRVLARHRLPRMWRYFSACVYAEKIRNDRIINLGGSILTRCTRALEARDQIGIQFYNPQGNDSTDIIMYHFDYLTLLLSGAFDAQARIAWRTYGIKKPIERYSSFRFKEFISSLGKCGAKSLKKIITDQQFSDLMILLYELRNTIHGANLTPISYYNSTKEGISYVALHKENAQQIWQAAERFSSPENWGLFQDHKILFEPYTYSITLINESFKFINAIANATDVIKLFPKGTTPCITSRPSNKDVFIKHIRKRVYLLG